MTPGCHSWSVAFFWTINFLLSSLDCTSQLQRLIQDMYSWVLLVAAAGRDSPMDISWGELMLVIKAITDLWGLVCFIFLILFLLCIFPAHSEMCCKHYNECLHSQSPQQTLSGFHIVSRLLPFCSSSFCLCELLFDPFLVPLLPQGPLICVCILSTPYKFLCLCSHSIILWSVSTVLSLSYSSIQHKRCN